MDNKLPHQISKPLGPLALVFAASCLILGCATPWEKSALLKDNLPNISSIQGPQERSLRNFFKKKQDDQDDEAGKPLKPILGTEEYLAATELYKDEKYEQARKAFRKIHKNRKYKKSEIREDALFMEAESAWQQDHYGTAHDAYAKLLHDFPSTRHLNVVSERLFTIGRTWLDFPEVAKLDEIKQVNFEDPSKHLPSNEPPAIPKSKPIFVPNFRDKKAPLFDTPGNGVAALTAVWMNDPTGPFADDAMMLVASYHARRGNYVEADRYFQNLRELYPNSPHVQNAFVIGSHVKLMSWQGPEYDTRTLQEAQLLKESILKLYPDLDSRRFRDELAKIEEAKAEVIWKRVLLYERKNKKRSSAIYCHDLISKYPNSKFAEMARTKLVNFGPEYESGAAFLTPIEDGKRPLYERILEPDLPIWMKDPRMLTKSRKTPTPTTEQSKSDLKRNESSRSKSAKEAADDEENDEPTKVPRRPRRLSPAESDHPMDDEEPESKPSKSARASQASFR